MYVKHPAMNGDGVVSVAMPNGTVKQLAMKEGVIDWPDAVPLHNRFAPSPEPEALREIHRKEKEAELRRMAAELGLTISESTDEISDKPEAAKGPKSVASRATGK